MKNKLQYLGNSGGLDYFAGRRGWAYEQRCIGVYTFIPDDELPEPVLRQKKLLGMIEGMIRKGTLHGEGACLPDMPGHRTHQRR